MGPLIVLRAGQYETAVTRSRHRCSRTSGLLLIWVDGSSVLSPCEHGDSVATHRPAVTTVRGRTLLVGAVGGGGRGCCSSTFASTPIRKYAPE